MNMAGKSAAAGHKTTATSWKPSITATACGATRHPVITMPICYVLKHITDNM